MNGISAFIRRDTKEKIVFFVIYGHRKKVAGCLQIRKKLLARHHIDQHLDFGPPNLLNCEK